MRSFLSLCLLSVFALTIAPYAQMIAAEEAKDDMQENRYFSVDYAEARQRFLNAARLAKADIESFQDTSLGQTEQLFIDVALLGPADAENNLVLISGVHGVEGFGGSGIQVGLLREGVGEWLPPKTGLVMIHALNPYGFANLRRFNEDNVDLNRNFLDHAGPYPENKGYDQLSEALAPKSVSFAANTAAMLRILWYRLWHGKSRLQQAVTQGQYSYPQGLFFGGHAASWSNQILHDIVERHLAHAARVVMVDFHTGLGPYGYGEIVMNEPVGTPAYIRAVRWWGKERVKSMVTGESVSTNLSGTIPFALSRMLPDAEITAVGLEFGTSPPMDVFRAIRAENWLHHHGGTDNRDAAKIKEQLLRAFYPDDDLWKSEVWEQGRSVVESVLKADR